MGTPIRNIRIPDDAWAALGAYASAVGTDRTKLLLRWTAEHVPAEYWPAPDAGGTLSLLDAIADAGRGDGRPGGVR